MKLSIIVPVYNTAQYLSKCLDSAIRPELPDYEIIIVNDGSTDISGELAAQYAGRFPSLVRLITTENGGLGAARNVGIEAASGEYLMFLDSDDYLTENAVSDMLSELECDADILIYDFVSVNSGGESIGIISGAGREGKINLSAYPELVFCPPAACNKLIRRSLFTDTAIRFPGRVWFEDLRTVPKLYLHTDNIVYLPRRWYNYLQRPGSITNSRSVERNVEIIDAVDELTAYYRSLGQEQRFHDELEYMAFHNQFLTSSTRVLLADKTSRVQEKLTADFISKYPDFRRNPYISGISRGHRLLMTLLLNKQWKAVSLLMRVNSIVKGKDR